MVEGWGQGWLTRIELRWFECRLPVTGGSPIDRVTIARMAMFGTDLPVIVAALAGATGHAHGGLSPPSRPRT